MAYTSEDTLAAQLHVAAELVTVGARYTHYKHPEQYYTVLDIVWDAAIDEPAVLYRAEYGKGLTFVRPVRMWLETVECRDGRCPRFTKVAA